ncbi:Hemolymph lipopolysaccharide-binding protein [Blattella germanica]|nr:Hemolymph lipopolysaccharide-binding protein [Blattella germanica]
MKLFAVFCWICCVNASSPNTDFKYSISSRRDLSGHWISKVQLEQDKAKYYGPVELEVGQTTNKYGAGEALVISATLSAPPGLPGPGYVLMPGFGYYKYHKVGKSWEDAVLACAAEGAYLAVPNSDAEYQAMKRIWDIHPSIYTDWRKNHFYIGLSDKAKEGEWITIFGQPINETGYTKWSAGEPDGGASQDCLLLTIDSTLHDISCSAEVSFMCERDI